VRFPTGTSSPDGYRCLMELSDLRSDERLALVALLEAAVVADGSVSDDEVEDIRKFVDAFGEDEYRKLVDEVSRRFQSRDDLLSFLETIERPEARELIYGLFLQEAAGEVVRGREPQLIAWLAETWGIEVKLDDGEAR
jgi:Tellurite resistance protein TerB